MPTIDRLLDSIRRAHDGTPWHGPSRADVLRDVTAEEAAWRPAPDAHTLWELVLHMRSWTREVLRRAKGEVPGDPLDGDFPAMPDVVDAAAWSEAQRSLDESHAALVAYVVAMNDEKRASRVKPRPGEEGTRTITQRTMIRSLAEHDVYHTGQLALMKRLARGAFGLAARDATAVAALPPQES